MSWGSRGDSSRASRLPQPNAFPRPPRPAVLVGLAHSLVDTGRTSEAEELCRWVLAADPNFHGAQIGLGRALLEEGRVEEAIEVLRASITAFPGSFAGYRWLGEALVRKGDWPRARAVLAQGALISPENRRIMQLLQLAGEARPTRRGFHARQSERSEDRFGPPELTPVTSPGAAMPPVTASPAPPRWQPFTSPPPDEAQAEDQADDQRLEQVKITGEFGPGSGATPELEPLEPGPRKPVALILVLAALIGLACGALIVRLLRGSFRPRVHTPAAATSSPAPTVEPERAALPAALADAALAGWLDLAASATTARTPVDRAAAALASALLATEYGVPLDATTLPPGADAPEARELTAAARALATLATGDVARAVSAARALSTTNQARGARRTLLAPFVLARALSRAGDLAGASAALAAIAPQELATFTPALLLQAELALDGGHPAGARELLDAIVASGRGAPRAQLLLEEARRALGARASADALASACADSARAPGVRLTCRALDASDRRRDGDARGASTALAALAADAVTDPRPLAHAALVLANTGDAAAEAFEARARKLADRRTPALQWAEAALALAKGLRPTAPSAPPVGPEQRLASARLARATSGDEGVRATMAAWAAWATRERESVARATKADAARAPEDVSASAASDADLRWYALLARMADAEPRERVRLSEQLLSDGHAEAVGPVGAFAASLLAGARRHLAMTWIARSIGTGPQLPAFGDVCFAAERYVEVAAALGRRARKGADKTGDKSGDKIADKIAEAAPALAAVRARCPALARPRRPR